MYFGSVKFFKHLILSVIALLIIIPTGLCIFSSISYHRLQVEIAAIAEKTAMAQRTAITENPSLLLKRFTGTSEVYAADNDFHGLISFAHLPYQDKYPNLYVDNDFTYITPENKTVYLTFDDGPSSLTSLVLDVLKEWDVKATFFVVYKGDEVSHSLYRRIVEEGHTLAVHTATHNYDKIYQSVDAYLYDFAQMAQTLEAVTGVAPELFRFPGGSVNNYNHPLYQPLIAEMTRRGYTYYDWNVSSADTSSKKTTQRICDNVISGAHANHESIVLMHDVAAHHSTLAALPTIITTLRAEGYSFAALDKTVKPMAFGYPD